MTLVENFLDFLRGTIPKEILAILEEEPDWFRFVAESESLTPDMVEELSGILRGEHFADLEVEDLFKHVYRSAHCAHCDVVFDSFFRAVDALPSRRALAPA